MLIFFMFPFQKRSAKRPSGVFQCPRAIDVEVPLTTAVTKKMIFSNRVPDILVSCGFSCDSSRIQIFFLFNQQLTAADQAVDPTVVQLVANQVNHRAERLATCPPKVWMASTNEEHTERVSKTPMEVDWCEHHRSPGKRDHPRPLGQDGNDHKVKLIQPETIASICQYSHSITKPNQHSSSNNMKKLWLLLDFD